MNGAHFHSILSHFKKFKPNGLRVVKWCGIVYNGPSSPIMSGWRKKPVTHPSLISPFPSPIQILMGQELGRDGEPHTAEKLPLKSSEPKVRSQNQRLPCFLECITGYCPHQTKPFHQRFLKHFFFSPLFSFEISWATINFRERERKIIQQGSITTLSFYCCNENLFPFPFVSHII